MTLRKVMSTKQHQRWGSMLRCFPLQNTKVLFSRSPQHIFNSSSRPSLDGSHTLTTSRQFSSKSPVGADEEQDFKEIVLYERGPGRLALARSGFGFSCFNTAYWAWYSVDFVPHVNASGIEALCIPPIIPAAGICFAAIVQAAFIFYPRMMISKLAWRPSTRQVLLYNYTLPFIQTTTRPLGISMGKLKMDASSPETKHITQNLGGDISRYSGYLWIRQEGQMLPFFLDIQESWDVKEPGLLLQALLTPERLTKSYESDDSTRQSVGQAQQRRKPRRSESQLRKIARRRR